MLQGVHLTPVVVACDAGWAKRGSGHSYTSNVGVTTFVDVDGDSKVADFLIKQKQCRKCDFFRARFKKCNPTATTTDFDNAISAHKIAHDCREDHRGQSSGSMESVSCVEMCQRMVEDGCLVRMIISDDDSTMRARTMVGAKCVLDAGYEVHRFGADPSHRTRTFGGHMFKFSGKALPGEVQGDSRLNSAVCTKFKTYHGSVLCSLH